ncbi:unnamed protein product [Trichogramma brassicae]|uniref:Uncharacterized protein n=1 Tax=Trichogramma brassicae TaxID=86971 RepID=A0A6H5J078_9HYME|nr:unnamed protein product [Trichogramma brassicae]
MAREESLGRASTRVCHDYSRARSYCTVQYMYSALYTGELAAAAGRLYDLIIFKCATILHFLCNKQPCEKCEVYSRLTEPEKQKKRTEMESHLECKEIVREMMKADKMRSKKDPTLCVANFDVEKLLLLPKVDIGPVYYMSKMCVLNFTIFELGVNLEHCNVWNETIGRKGANEIASFLLDFIMKKSGKGVKNFIFYSDNCAGQNRNKMLFSMYFKAARKYKVSITHSERSLATSSAIIVPQSHFDVDALTLGAAAVAATTNAAATNVYVYNHPCYFKLLLLLLDCASELIIGTVACREIYFARKAGANSCPIGQALPRCATTTMTISRGTRAQDLDSSSSSSSRKQQTRNYFEEEVPRDVTVYVVCGSIQEKRELAPCGLRGYRCSTLFSSSRLIGLFFALNFVERIEFYLNTFWARAITTRCRGIALSSPSFADAKECRVSSLQEKEDEEEKETTEIIEHEGKAYTCAVSASAPDSRRFFQTCTYEIAHGQVHRFRHIYTYLRGRFAAVLILYHVRGESEAHLVDSCAYRYTELCRDRDSQTFPTGEREGV